MEKMGSNRVKERWEAESEVKKRGMEGRKEREKENGRKLVG